MIPFLPDTLQLLVLVVALIWLAVCLLLLSLLGAVLAFDAIRPRRQHDLLRKVA